VKGFLSCFIMAFCTHGGGSILLSGISDLSLTLGMCPTGGGGGDRIPPDDSSKPGPAPGSLDCGLNYANANKTAKTKVSK
jgi:hypothetical protein